MSNEESFEIHIERMSHSQEEYDPYSPHGAFYDAFNALEDSICSEFGVDQLQPFVIKVEPNKNSRRAKLEAFEKANDIFQALSPLESWAVHLKPQEDGDVHIEFTPVSSKEEKAKKLFNDFWENW